jgi:hypothetical protein
MPNVTFWVGDLIYSKWVNLPAETKKELKEKWRSSVKKATE